VLWLLLLSWRKRASLRRRREQAKQETKVLALLTDHGRFTGQPIENLVQAFGSNYTYGGLDFGQFMLEWEVGTLRIVAWGKEAVCESISVERSAS